MPSPLILHNPHSVIAALETRPQDVHWLQFPRDGASEAWRAAAELAESVGVRVAEYRSDGEDAGFDPMPRKAKKKGRGPRQIKSGRGGGAAAQLAERPPVSENEIFADIEPRDERHGIWLALDCIQDPHNIGAIFRSAAFFGVRGIVLPRDRTAPLSAVAYDVASGGIEYVPHSLATNLRRALATAKKRGIWTLGTSEHAEQDLRDADRDRPWLIVLGNEEQGLRRLIIEECDEVRRLSPIGPIASLNVSVAASVCLSIMTSR